MPWGQLTRVMACAVLTLLTATHPAAPSSLAQDRDRAWAIDRLMRDYQGAVPGASVLVLHEGRAVFRRAYGLADLERRVPATTHTDYRLASLTKQFTAAAVLILAQEGKLTLDDPLRRWLPSLPAATPAMTLRQLLTHTSGLIDYEEIMPADTQVPLHDADVLRLLEREDRTYFLPGTGWRYSDSGYALLSLVVARASGMSFASFLHERIFAPLHMDATVAYEEGISAVPSRAYGYSVSAYAAGAAQAAGSTRWVRTDQSLTSAVLGDGGVYSSVEDLAKWDAALYGGGPLAAQSLRRAFAPAARTDDPAVQYGLGWRITGETLWHSGETIGFRNVIVRWPRRRFTVIVLTNRNDPEPYTRALAIAKLWFRDADAVRASQVVVGPDSGLRPIAGCGKGH